MSFGFIIPICIKNNIHFNQLKRCLRSIRTFYENIKIILIDDSNIQYTKLIEEYSKLDNNIVIKKSFKNGSADQQMFKVFLETELFEKAIFIQDSMILNKKLEDINDIDIKFIWHFTNHRIHWDLIKEPDTEYNIKNNIKSHTDLIMHNLLRDYNDNNEFQNYAVNKLKNKNEWCGCFGSLCIINKKSLIFLNNKINFIDKFINSTSNRDRRVNESIFALICHFSFPEINFEKSYDDLHYDGYNHGGDSNMINKNTGFDNLKWFAVHSYFNKVSFNR
jgi:hypothetical protein